MCYVALQHFFPMEAPMPAVSGFPFASDSVATLAARKGMQPFLLIPEAVRTNVAESTDAANRVLDLWADAFTCTEQMAIAALKSGQATADVLDSHSLAHTWAAHPAVWAAEFAWSVIEAACLPYREVSGWIVDHASGAPRRATGRGAAPILS